MRNYLSEVERKKEFETYPDKYVQCQICFKHFERISTFHMTSIHNISIKEYKEKFPEAKILSKNVRDKLSKSSTNRRFDKTIKQKMSASRKRFLSNNKFIAPVLLMTDERKKEWRKNISISVIKEFANLTTEQRQKRIGNNSRFISKLETDFLDYVEQDIWGKIKRQLHVVLDNKKVKLIDGSIEFKSFKVFIEVDGKHWHNFPYGTLKDVELDLYCESQKIKLFRFWDTDIIKNKEKCKNQIISYIENTLTFFEAIALAEIGGKQYFNSYLKEEYI